MRYTERELDAMRRRGEDMTDESRLDSRAESDAVPADEGAFDWGNAVIGIPPPKQQLTMRLDRDLVDWFRAQGKGYQTRINAVLRRYVEAQRGR